MDLLGEDIRTIKVIWTILQQLSLQFMDQDQDMHLSIFILTLESIHTRKKTQTSNPIANSICLRTKYKKDNQKEGNKIKNLPKLTKITKFRNIHLHNFTWNSSKCVSNASNIGL
jgi:hypothetical protein